MEALRVEAALGLVFPLKQLSLLNSWHEEGVRALDRSTGLGGEHWRLACQEEEPNTCPQVFPKHPT